MSGRTPWNKGLNAKTDERVRKSCEKQHKTMRELYAEGKLQSPMKGKKFSEESKRKMSESRLKALEEGKIKVWNKGLTIADERVRNVIDKNKKWRRDNLIGKTYEEAYGVEKAKEIKEKMGKIQSKIKLGVNNPMYGKHHTNEWKIKHGERMRGEKHPLYGTHHTEEQRRIQSEKMVGRYLLDKNPNWRGGTSFEPYGIEFNNQFRRLIRKRDNQICMLCGIHKEKLRGALDVHHINYDKNLSIPQNCISLCRKCHVLTQTKTNKEYWTNFFQSLLAERYNYQYSENKEIKLNLNGGLLG